MRSLFLLLLLIVCSGDLAAARAEPPPLRELQQQHVTAIEPTADRARHGSRKRVTRVRLRRVAWDYVESLGIDLRLKPTIRNTYVELSVGDEPYQVSFLRRGQRVLTVVFDAQGQPVRHIGIGVCGRVRALVAPDATVESRDTADEPRNDGP